MPVISGAGAASTVRKSVVTLDNATIKALPTTGNAPPFGYPIVTGAGAGTLIVPLAFSVVLRGTGYTNVDAAATFQAAYSGFAGFQLSTILMTNAGLVAPDVHNVSPVTNWQGLDAGGVPKGGLTTIPSDDGVGLVLWAGNGGLGDFTGGAAGNTLVVTTLYVVIDF